MLNTGREITTSSSWLYNYSCPCITTTKNLKVFMSVYKVGIFLHKVSYVTKCLGTLFNIWLLQVLIP